MYLINSILCDLRRQWKKENMRYPNQDDKEESKEPDYDEDKDQLEEEQEEKETGETAAATINKVYW